MRKSKLMRQVEKAWHRPLEDLLLEKLADHTPSEVAEELDIRKSTLGYWLLKLGFRRESKYVRRETHADHDH